MIHNRNSQTVVVHTYEITDSECYDITTFLIRARVLIPDSETPKAIMDFVSSLAGRNGNKG